MQTAQKIVGILAGLMLIIFGLNKFLHFIPMQAPTGDALEVMMGFVKSGYIMLIVAVVEIVAGVAYLLGRYVALMSIVLLPISINAFLFHLMLDPANIGGATLLITFNIFLMWAHKERYTPLFKA